MSSSLMYKEKRVICPYNPSHSVDPLKMPFHLNKCKKNYPDIKMSICPFNATHHVRKEKLHLHVEECKDKHIFERELFIRSNPDLVNYKCSKSAEREVLNINNNTGENWNTGVAAASYDQSKNILDIEYSRNPLSELGEGGRKFWREVDYEGIERLSKGMPIVDLTPTLKGGEIGISKLLNEESAEESIQD